MNSWIICQQLHDVCCGHEIRDGLTIQLTDDDWTDDSRLELVWLIWRRMQLGLIDDCCWYCDWSQIDAIRVWTSPPRHCCRISSEVAASTQCWRLQFYRRLRRRFVCVTVGLRRAAIDPASMLLLLLLQCCCRRRCNRPWVFSCAALSADWSFSLGVS